MSRSKTPIRPKPINDPIFREQLSRNEQFFKKQNQRTIEASYVIVVGLGGVGSHAAHMLARAGVGRLRLIDFDQVTLSSLNRHAVATRADVGVTKVEACKQHFLHFNPHCQVDAIPRMFTEEAAEELILGKQGGRPDYVIDCIDDATTKAALVAFCVQQHLPMICSLAAGGKSDPTRIRIGDLSDPMRDPLARKLRTVLRLKNVWSWIDTPGQGTNEGGRKLTNVTGTLPKETNIKVCYSTQSPVCPLEPLTQEQREEGANNFGAIENMRVRVMPVLGTVPALFGMAMSSFVLCEIGNKTFAPLASRKMSKKTVHKVREKLKRHEFNRHQIEGDAFNVSEDDVAYLMEHVWHMRCAYTGIHMEGSRAKKVILQRYDISKPASVTNLILLTEKSAKIHDQMTLRTGNKPDIMENETDKEDNEPSTEVMQFVAKAIQHTLTSEEYNMQRIRFVKGDVGGVSVNYLHLGVVLLVAMAVGYILTQNTFK